jgi:soluble lytic murein transglycosylase-like protein
MSIVGQLALRWAERLVGLAMIAVSLAWAIDVLAQVPLEAAKYKRDLVRNARLEWGLDAPTATFAAQIHQESGWRHDVVSPAGAQGMAQFMPATGQWLAGLYEHLGPHDAFNPAWAIRAMVAYDRHLFQRMRADTHCERMAKTLAAYNGGEAWVLRDEKLAESKGLDPIAWFDNVERVNAGRSEANWRENRGYPRRILHELEPRYFKERWGIRSCVT